MQAYGSRAQAQEALVVALDQADGAVDQVARRWRRKSRAPRPGRRRARARGT